MYYAICKDKSKNKVFTKYFESPFFLSKFLAKIKRSKNIIVISYSNN